jgi:hypothetical protein
MKVYSLLIQPLFFWKTLFHTSQGYTCLITQFGRKPISFPSIIKGRLWNNLFLYEANKTEPAYISWPNQQNDMLAATTLYVYSFHPY